MQLQRLAFVYPKCTCQAQGSQLSGQLSNVLWSAARLSCGRELFGDLAGGIRIPNLCTFWATWQTKKLWL